MGNIDLHIHSSFSEDADLPVDEIFALASRASLAAISITDHDSLQSIPAAESVGEQFALEYVPGVEITTVFEEDGSQQHILGYYIDEKNEQLKETIEIIKNYRLGMARKRIEALKSIGFALDDERIWKMIGDRPPTATSIMVEVFKNEKNRSDARLTEYIQGDKSRNRLSQFYRGFLSEGKEAYVPFESINAQKAIEVIKGSGGVSVLAHPKFLKRRDLLPHFIDYGIDGIEAITTYHDESDVRFFIEFARANGLLITAGSDFHGPTSKPQVTIGGVSGNSYEYFSALKSYYEGTSENY